MTTQRFSRIETVLQYLHDNLAEQHTVASLAQVSCWSRWQFQRVFNDVTGLSVAQYVRELRLSRAAEALLDSQAKHIDIALSCGFDSEISFHRAFKQQFGCTPGQYRKRGKRVALKTPLRSIAQQAPADTHAFRQIRIETQPSFTLIGLSATIQGPFSNAPNFTETVPKIWQRYHSVCNSADATLKFDAPFIGVIDTRDPSEAPLAEKLIYWAGRADNAACTSIPTQLECLTLPEQTYAVIPIEGDVRQIEQALRWFMHTWLPNSTYRGVAGFELEIYPSDYDPALSSSHMEYWLPIVPRAEDA
ncbi:AraC family transcriptional regulator [Marinomonas ostreistagni]|uniref:AraC family transcriptional regulator n=1 Tax=Marinomonas ostreistagni TaxID=359209 RepID=UPI00195119E0|nr:AraC family transcriptional regulator [Marinomonas ostreistagni]MBM6550662.1 AraC family transcriptional regulator [Marinomonas ostreistagni]